MKHGAGWPMGPCALVDLVGIDVHVHASEALCEKLREPRMAPPPRLVAMATAGLLGRKSGRGFYRYDGVALDRRREPPAWRVRGLGRATSTSSPGARYGSSRPAAPSAQPSRSSARPDGSLRRAAARATLGCSAARADPDDTP